ncbi:MAG: hypothetical protein WA960_04810 [Tunicatimonas sp.]
MKTRISLSFLLTLFAFTTYAQCDNTFYPMGKDHYYEVEVFDKKDKLQATSQYTIAAVAETDNGYEATVNSKTLDKKGELIGGGDFTVICEDGQLKMDMQRLLTSLTQLQNTQGMNVEIEGDHIIIPASLSVGEVLPESTTTIKVGMEGMSMTMNTTTVTIRDRTVAAQEDVTTPAGTFPCYKVTYVMNASVETMGISREMVYTGTEWLSEGVGMVRNEQYDKKDKLSSYSVLTVFK